MTGIKRGYRTVSRKVYIPEELSGEIDLLLADMVRRKPKYGAFSQLVTKLLMEYIANLKKVIPDHGSQSQSNN